MSASSPTSRRGASNATHQPAPALERVGTTPDPESLHEALVECVKAAGGSKAVAAELWPARAQRDIDDARRYLANCLNAERAEKLSLDEVLFVLRLARERGCHIGMQFLCSALGYAPPQPVAPADAADDLRRRFIAATAQLSRMAQQIHALEEARR